MTQATERAEAFEAVFDGLSETARALIEAPWEGPALRGEMSEAAWPFGWPDDVTIADRDVAVGDLMVAGFVYIDDHRVGTYRRTGFGRAVWHRRPSPWDPAPVPADLWPDEDEE